MGLVRCGYTPKWLDEEFPLLPEGATKKEADLPEGDKDDCHDETNRMYAL